MRSHWTESRLPPMAHRGWEDHPSCVDPQWKDVQSCFQRELSGIYERSSDLLSHDVYQASSDSDAFTETLRPWCQGHIYNSVLCPFFHSEVLETSCHITNLCGCVPQTCLSTTNLSSWWLNIMFATCWDDYTLTLYWIICRKFVWHPPKQLSSVKISLLMPTCGARNSQRDI